MNFKPILFLFLFLSIAGSRGIAGSVRVEANAIVSIHWSIISCSSRSDSLKAGLKKPVPALGIRAVKEYLQSLQFREQLKASDNIPVVFPTSAGVYNGSLKTDSLSAYDQLLFLYRNLGDRNAEAGVLNSYAINHALKGNIDQALLLFNEALGLNLLSNNRIAVTKNYFNLARVNNYRGNFSEAIKYNHAIVDIALNTRSNATLAEAYMNLADLWTSQGNYKEAETMILKKALPLYYYKLHDMIGAMKCYDQLAEIYQQQKRFSEAKWFNIQSNMLARKISNPSGIVHSLINLAHVKMAIGDYQLALRDIREAEQLSIKNKYSHQMVEIKNDLSEVYRKLGNTGAANLAFSEFTVLKDALLSTAY